MFSYYTKLALRSFRRNKALTALMVLAIALGIGGSMTTLTLLDVLSGNPIPNKSDRLFFVQLDPRRMGDYQPGEEPSTQLTRFDAEALLSERRGEHQAMMSGGKGVIQPDGTALRPFIAGLRYTSTDFFAMFETPLRYGQGWSAQDDTQHNPVAVIASALNDKLFGGGNSIGKTVGVEGHMLRIVGVLDDWSPKPHFYDLTTGHYDSNEQVFLPFSTAMDLKLGHEGTISCFGTDVPADQLALNAPCTWVQYWVELESAAEVSDYLSYLESYSAEQRAVARFERPPNVRLRNVMQWLDHREVVPRDVHLQVYLALGFLAVCIINTVGLLLAKFLRRSGEIAVRRALGATRREIFQQYLTEAGSIGLAGGTLGLALALLGLWAVRQQPVSYAHLAHLNLEMLLLTFVLAVLASLLAGLLPAWRACNVSHTAQLKSQ